MTPTPQCEFKESVSPEEYREQLLMRRDILVRFEEWARYFGIKTCIRKMQSLLTTYARDALVPQVPVLVWERA